MFSQREKLKIIENTLDEEISLLENDARWEREDDSIDYDFENMGLIRRVITYPLVEEKKRKEEVEDIGSTVKRIREKSLKRKSLKKEIYEKRCLKRFRKCRNVHLVFLCDITGDVGSQIIRIVRENLKSFQKEYCIFSSGELEVAFIGYRSVKDRSRREVMNFGTVDDLYKFLGGVKSSEGNGGRAVDVFGGFEKLFDLYFDSNHPTRVVIHLGNAPCHGKEYQDPSHNIVDEYPEFQVENILGRICKWLRERLIQYYFVEIPQGNRVYTRVMTSKFKKTYEETGGEEEITFTVYNKSEESFLEIFSRSIERSISKRKELYSREVMSEIRDLTGSVNKEEYERIIKGFEKNAMDRKDEKERIEYLIKDSESERKTVIKFSVEGSSRCVSIPMFLGLFI